MKNIATSKELVTDVQPHTVDVLEVNTDARSYVRLGWFIVLFGVLGFLVWASFAPLDQGAPAHGIVVSESGRKTIQHQTGGTIEEILVKDGDEVKAGQVLVKMNSVVSQSSADVTYTQLVTASAMVARLTAERANAGKITFPKWLLDNKKDSHVANSLFLQEQLFSSRRMAVEADLSAFEENMGGLKMQLHGLEASMINKKEQQTIVKEQVENIRDLAKDGYIARNRLLDTERTFAQINSAVSEDLGNIGRIKRQLAEANLRKMQRLQEYQKEVRTQLSDAQREVESLQSRTKIYEQELDHALVKAPVDGTIVGINVFTKGGVVQAGFKLMELVPAQDPLIIEGSLPINLIDKVHPGLDVQFIFSAFNTNTTPHIPGKITQVSADRAMDERTGAPYYKFHAEVTPEGKKLLGKLQIRPGMPVDMTIKTGERTMMNYLLRPILDRAHSAMKEN
ncbi:HlyD family type I secretion periplasmic adaptor subunit [Undibacterium danionis]|uniref:Membrane fusion protein (MFP) family protein n=1 Tax=Undibacterium danionis TaxID=1812100 RepID=A0ABV6IJW0_9BURK